MSKRVCIYVRVSTTKQTVENQIQVLKEYSDRCGYQITQIYSDNGISGSKGRQDRPGLDQMMKDGVQRKFEMVLVWSVDRLGRSVTHLVEVMNELNELKIDLYLVLYCLFGGRYTNIDTNSFRHDLTLSEHVFGTVEGKGSGEDYKFVLNKNILTSDMG